MSDLTLSDAISLYLTRRAVLVSANTLRNDKLTLARLLEDVGDQPITGIHEADVEEHMAHRLQVLRASSANTTRAHLRTFFTWLQHNHYILGNPARDLRRGKVRRTKPLHLPMSRFPELLNAAGHPRDRACLALGIYAFLRQGEMATLRWSDIDMDAHTFSADIWKTGDVDEDMPMFPALHTEMLRWRGYWEWQRGREPRPEEYVIPHLLYGDLVPDRMVVKPWQIVQRALLVMGYQLYDENGRSRGLGYHTLRRSGARALFDHLAEKGHDRAMRTVMSMLHHTQQQTTEIYLGIDADKSARNRAVLTMSDFGQEPATSATVVPLFTHAKEA